MHVGNNMGIMTTLKKPTPERGTQGGGSPQGPTDRDEVPNVRRSKRPLQSLPTPHSLWLLKRCMPSIWKPSIRRCDAAVPPIAGVLICMPRRQDASKNGEMGTGWCLMSSACPLRPIKSRQWLEGFWNMASRSMRSS